MTVAPVPVDEAQAGERPPELPNEHLVRLYRDMARIRAFEEEVVDAFRSGLIPGSTHPCIGQEASKAGSLDAAKPSDLVLATYRGHGEALLKGVDPVAMMAELMGRATGVCKGKGGSMHIADVDKGMLGANGIVGGGLPLAAGAALTANTLVTGGVAVCFFGDGASNQGTFHEAINLAAIWKLPVVFLCENNGYAESTPFHYHCSTTDIANRAGAYDIPGVVVDGLDLFSVYEAAGEAIARARRGDGPSIIEAKTYRYYGHFQGDMVTYRTDEELARFKERDAIQGVRRYAVEHGLATADELDEIETRTRALLEAAWTQGKADPFPEESALLTDVYVSY